MNRAKLQDAVNNGMIEWRKHALERLLQRNITRNEVKKALVSGDVIEVYVDDKPFESALFLYIDTKPLHVVASFDVLNNMVYIITAYVPDSENFEDDFKKRRSDEDK